jgi:hypothetical protein
MQYSAPDNIRGCGALRRVPKTAPRLIRKQESRQSFKSATSPRPDDGHAPHSHFSSRNRKGYLSSPTPATEHTVKKYLFRLFDKLGISSRVELVLYAVNRGAPLQAEWLAGVNHSTPDS